MVNPRTPPLFMILILDIFEGLGAPVYRTKKILQLRVDLPTSHGIHTSAKKRSLVGWFTPKKPTEQENMELKATCFFGGGEFHPEGPLTVGHVAMLSKSILVT